MQKIQLEVNQNQHKVLLEVISMRKLFLISLCSVSFAFAWGNKEMMTEACPSNSTYFDAIQGCCSNDIINLYKDGLIPNDRIERFCKRKETDEDKLYIARKHYEKGNLKEAFGWLPSLLGSNDENVKKTATALTSQLIDELLKELQLQNENLEDTYSKRNIYLNDISKRYLYINNIYYMRYIYTIIFKHFPEKVSKDTMKLACDTSIKFENAPYLLCQDVFVFSYQYIDDPKLSPILREKGINRKWLLSAIKEIFDRKEIEEAIKKRVSSIDHEISVVSSMTVESALRHGMPAGIDPRYLNEKSKEKEKIKENYMKIFDIKRRLEDEILEGKE